MPAGQTLWIRQDKYNHKAAISLIYGACTACMSAVHCLQPVDRAVTPQIQDANNKRLLRSHQTDNGVLVSGLHLFYYLLHLLLHHIEAPVLQTQLFPFVELQPARHNNAVIHAMLASAQVTALELEQGIAPCLLNVILHHGMLFL